MPPPVGVDRRVLLLGGSPSLVGAASCLAALLRPAAWSRSCSPPRSSHSLRSWPSRTLCRRSTPTSGTGSSDRSRSYRSPSAVAAAIVRPPLPALRRRPVARARSSVTGSSSCSAWSLPRSSSTCSRSRSSRRPTTSTGCTYHLTRARALDPAGIGGAHRGRRRPAHQRVPAGCRDPPGATMLLSGSVRWVGLVQFGALLVAMLAIYGIAGRIGLDRRQAAFGALLFATLPVVALQAPTSMNDLVVAALVACCGVLRARAQRPASSRSRSSRSRSSSARK